MGQALSDEKPPVPSPEEVHKELARKFADKCFTPLEIYSLKGVFKSLADSEQNVRYLKEDTIARFLEIPDAIGVSPVLFQMMSYIGAFPFLQDAPAVLGLEEMVMVVTIMTERYRRVLAQGPTDRTKLFFKSLAVYDRKLNEAARDKTSATEETEASAEGYQSPVHMHAPPGFAVDLAGEEEEDDVGPGDDDVELVLAALDSLDYLSVFRQGEAPKIREAMIPADNLHKLIMLLLLIAPLGAQESLSLHAGRLVGEELKSLRVTADCVLAAFLNVEQLPGIKFSRFRDVIPASMPFLFNGLAPLFEHFLFSNDLDFQKRKDGAPAVPPQIVPRPILPPPVQNVTAIMNTNLVSQLSLFLPGSSLFHRLRLLYSGDEDGFSMSSFESKVFNWRAPTILLVSGVRLANGYHQDIKKPEADFLQKLPPRQWPHGSEGGVGARVTFGAYLSSPWKYTYRECFGDQDTLLFQLQPVHDVFRASSVNRDYASFIKPSASGPSLGGVAFGCPPPQPSKAYLRSTSFAYGSVSLLLDSNFEFGCFSHDYTLGGGAFGTSAARKFDFQERFEVTSLEVWGCGGDEEAKNQEERWAWEAREAEARRRINLGTGDIEADRALLEMAGLIGGNRSGGSMW